MSNSKLLKFVQLRTDIFGYVADDSRHAIPIKRFTWTNQSLVKVEVITYGATITSIRIPNKKGLVEDILLGFEDLHGYTLNKRHYIGPTIGRFAGTIKDGCFFIGQNFYILNRNRGKHHFNGGRKGFHQLVWDSRVAGNKVILSHTSKEYDQGYPGTLKVCITFELNCENEFNVDYKAETTEATVVNLSNSLYFNLAGHNAGPEELRRHKLSLNSSILMNIDGNFLHTGTFQSVSDTDNNLTQPVEIGSLIDELGDIHLHYNVSGDNEEQLHHTATLSHDRSGRTLEIYSNQLGVCINSANTLPMKPGSNIYKVKKCPVEKKLSLATTDLLEMLYQHFYKLALVDKNNSYGPVLLEIRNFYQAEFPFEVPTEKMFETCFKYLSFKVNKIDNYKIRPNQKNYINILLEKVSEFEDNKHLSKLKQILNMLIDEEGPEYDIVSEKSSTNMNHGVRGIRNTQYWKHGGICVQTQRLPYAGYYPKLPICELQPEAIYQHTIKYKFKF